MTLAESKMTKVMKIEGTFTGVIDLTELWFRVCLFPSIQLGGTVGNYHIKYHGSWDEGLYVLGIVTETVRQAKADCHLEVNCVYEDN